MRFMRKYKKIFDSVDKLEILSHQKNISWNQLFSNFFSENWKRCFHEICERIIP